MEGESKKYYMRKHIHYAWLDAIRFIAAFLVLLCHSRNDFFMKYNFLDENQQNPITFLFYLIGRMGSEAVFAFFILSGFLVGGPGFERIFKSTFDVKNYAVDRSVRIMLPLISAIVMYLVLAPCVGENINWWNVVGNFFSLQCILCDPLVSPFWSLSYEVWFYVFLAAFALVMQRKRYGYLLFIICCLVYLKMNALYLLMWLIGAAAYLTKPSKFSKWQFFLSIIVLISAIAFTQMTKASKAMSFDLPNLGEGYNLILCISMGWFIQQIILLEPKNKLLKNIEQSFGKLANFSYTLYLTHRITLLVVFTLFIKREEADMSFNNIMIFVFIMMICLVVAYAIFYIAERHTRDVKIMIKKKLGLIQNYV